MARINLLPWREDYRQKRKKDFLTLLVGIFILAGFVAYLWVSSVQSSISDQRARNLLLQTEISALEQQVSEIQELKSRREELLNRMRVIQDLEGTRPVIVRIFDEMVRAIPDGVFLDIMGREGDVIILSGIAESNNRVSSFMRNLDESNWFAAPNLNAVTAAAEYGEQANSFNMTVRISAPSDKSDDDDDDEGGE